MKIPSGDSLIPVDEEQEEIPAAQAEQARKRVDT